MSDSTNDVHERLTKQHGATVTILDRTWIVEQVIDGDRKDLAFNYLHYNKLPKGGHFAAWEQPKFLSEEMRVGFRSLRK